MFLRAAARSSRSCSSGRARRVVLPSRPPRAGVARGGEMADVVALARSDRAACIHGSRVPLRHLACLARDRRRGDRGSRPSSFVCTAMIYACLAFLREWASPLTWATSSLAGSASGFTLAAAFAAVVAPDVVRFLVGCALVLTLAASRRRIASLIRNARLRPKSTLQTALGIKHPHIVQRSMGFMGGSFNTREFFHGRSPMALRSIKWIFLATAFAIPLALQAAVWLGASPFVLPVAFVDPVRRPAGRALVLLRRSESSTEPLLPGDRVGPVLCRWSNPTAARSARDFSKALSTPRKRVGRRRCRASSSPRARRAISSCSASAASRRLRASCRAPTGRACAIGCAPPTACSGRSRLPSRRPAPSPTRCATAPTSRSRTPMAVRCWRR